MNSDKETLSVYDARADDYAELGVGAGQKTMLSSFIAKMPANARVLDLGCGPGHAAAAMQNAGLQADAFDASPEMVKIAGQNNGVNAQLKTFDELETENTYNGIWASFSLLHAPKSSFPAHLNAIRRALIPDGLLTLGMKLGQGEERDKIGRFYAYYSQPELENHLTDAGFTLANFNLGESVGLAGDSAPFIAINAHA